MGRNTRSEIVFFQQLGRALAVKKSKDGTKEDITPPLIIDFMNNFRNILSLYNKVVSQGKTLQREMDGSEGNEQEQFFDFDGTNNGGDFFNFGLSEELVNVLMELEQIKSKVEFTLSFEGKLEEAYEYLKKYKTLPTVDQKGIRFSDGSAEIGRWLRDNKKKIYELYLSNDELATKFVQTVLVKYPDYFDTVKKKLADVEKLTFEEQLEEAYEYLKKMKYRLVDKKE